jgi:hypothetical protein
LIQCKVLSAICAGVMVALIKSKWAEKQEFLTCLKLEGVEAIIVAVSISLLIPGIRLSAILKRQENDTWISAKGATDCAGENYMPGNK